MVALVAAEQHGMMAPPASAEPRAGSDVSTQPRSRVLDPFEPAFWQSVAHQPHRSLFTSRPWLEVLRATYGFAIEAAVAATAPERNDALLFCHLEDLRGPRVISLPFSDYCDPLLTQPTGWRALVEPLLCRGAPVRMRCLRSDAPATDGRFRLSGRALWHGTDLTADEATLWSRLDASARQNVRKALRNGISVHEETSIDAVLTFYALHVQLRKQKYRLLAQPRAFFERLHDWFAPDERLVVLLAKHDGQAIAGILFLEFDGTLYYKFNASADSRLRPNDLLAWEGLRLGHRRGLVRLDFGLSDTEQPGLVRYKRKFATEEREIFQWTWVPEGFADRRGEEAGRVLRTIVDLLTASEVSETTTRRAGDALYYLFA